MNKENISVIARPPGQYSTKEIEAFQRLVIDGGEVDQGTLPDLIPKALSLAIATRGSGVVATAGLKRPNHGYRARVFKKAGVISSDAKYEFELGWVFVHESARNLRLATKLVESLIPALEEASAYATSRVDNERMHATLRRVGFAPVGTPYPSQQSASTIQLFVFREYRQLGSSHVRRTRRVR